MKGFVFGGGGGGGGAADWNYFRNVGTGGGLGERWYVGNTVSSTLTSGTVRGANELEAVPYVEVRGGTLDRIAVYQNDGAAGNIRLGIYTSTTFGTNLYPNQLVVDSGAIVGGLGIKSAVINQALTADTLYWLVYLSDAARDIHRVGDASLGTILGIDDWTGVIGLSIARAYGALPAAFPAGAGLVYPNQTIPAIAVRYSA